MSNGSFVDLNLMKHNGYICKKTPSGSINLQLHPLYLQSNPYAMLNNAQCSMSNNGKEVLTILIYSGLRVPRHHTLLVRTFSKLLMDHVSGFLCL